VDLLLVHQHEHGARGRNTMTAEACPHILAIERVTPAKKRECHECVRIGGRWVHLRTCQECGVTLCCDASPNQHASKHAHAMGHPVIASAEPGQRWLLNRLNTRLNVAPLW
jgi:hypothetical protein